MSSHKKQHTIPRSYLAAWIDPMTPQGQTGAIWRISKDHLTARRKAPGNSFTETDRYTILMKDGTRNLTVENSLARIERDFQGVLKAIRRKEKLTVIQRAKLCTFTAAMLGRSKKQGNHMHDQWSARIAKVKSMENKIHAAGQLLSEQLEEANRNSHAHLVVDTIQIAAPILFGMSLTFLTTGGTDDFITSDAPAVMYNPRAHTLPPMLRSPGLLQQDVEVTLPLSPHHVALFSYKPMHLLYTPTQSQIVDEVNRTTYFFSDTEFVSWKGVTKEIWFEKREAPSDAWKE